MPQGLLVVKELWLGVVAQSPPARPHHCKYAGVYGLVDPTKVAHSALQNAASVAWLLITTGALIVDKKKGDDSSAGGGGGWPVTNTKV